MHSRELPVHVHRHALIRTERRRRVPGGRVAVVYHHAHVDVVIVGIDKGFSNQFRCKGIRGDTDEPVLKLLRRVLREARAVAEMENERGGN